MENNIVEKICAWEYRLTKMGTFFAFREVYYGKEGEIILASENPVGPMGDSQKSFNCDLEEMLGALKKPIIKITTEEDGSWSFKELRRERKK